LKIALTPHCRAQVKFVFLHEIYHCIGESATPAPAFSGATVGPTVIATLKVLGNTQIFPADELERRADLLFESLADGGAHGPPTTDGSTAGDDLADAWGA
jgi:hypothetical protein